MAGKLILRALTGELRGQQFAFTGPTNCVLGRSRRCNVQLPGDGTVSRQHCIIEIDCAGVWVQDLGSMNGTHVNGERIDSRGNCTAFSQDTIEQSSRWTLHDGDELRICNNVFAVVLPDEDMVVMEDKGTIRSSSDSFIVLSL